MTPDIATIGFILIIAGIVLILAASLSGQKDAKVAVGGVIGFVPFGFGNDPQLVKVSIIISAVLFIIFIVFLLKGFV